MRVWGHTSTLEFGPSSINQTGHPLPRVCQETRNPRSPCLTLRTSLSLGDLLRGSERCRVITLKQQTETYDLSSVCVEFSANRSSLCWLLAAKPLSSACCPGYFGGKAWAALISLRRGLLWSQWDVLEISLARSSEGSEWGRAVRGLPGRLLL